MSKRIILTAASTVVAIIILLSSPQAQVIIQGVLQLGTAANPAQGFFANGTSAAPSISFASSATSGLYLVGSNIGLSSPVITAGTDSTLIDAGDLIEQRYSTTITPATAGTANCGASFLAAALTADCVIATLPAGMMLEKIYADVTVGFACSGTCTGTKVMQAGTATAGVQVFAAGLNVAATGQFGLADANMGSGLTRAAAIQGGLIGSWTTTTPISVRFTSGTGNWGSGVATFVNAGSIKFTLITKQIK